MASEWIECKLSDACSAIDYGLTASAEADGGGPRFLRITDIVPGFIDWDSVPHVTADDDTVCKYRLLHGDIVIARTGASTGASAYVKNPPLAVFASYLVRLRATREFDSQFLAYYLKSALFLRFIRSVIGDKSAQPNASASTMTMAPLRAPRDVGEQRAIARILGALDDKIELNRRMNETLEAMARALFRSWFVNFDLVKAKSERCNSTLPENIVDLFPFSFEDSELGQIPKGWSATNWGSKVILEYGRSLTDYANANGPYPVYGTNGQIGTHVAPLCQREGIIIGRKGAYRGIHYCNVPFYVIDTAFYVKPTQPMEMKWAYYELLRTDINSFDSGSAIPSTSREDFYSIPVVCPPFKVQRAFVRQMSPTWERQEQAKQESQILARLRDALLPKLIAGELRVRDAERAVEQVA